MAREGELTVKQARFVKEYAENGGNGTKAALVAYDIEDPNTASSIATENLRKPDIREAVNNAMVAAGLDAESLLKPIKAALEAETNHYEYDKDGRRKLTKVVDHGTRLKASELGLKLAGALTKDGTATNVNISFNQHVAEKKQEYGL